jgi:hypothetical protein
MRINIVVPAVLEDIVSRPGEPFISLILNGNTISSLYEALHSYEPTLCRAVFISKVKIRPFIRIFINDREIPIGVSPDAESLVPGGTVVIVCAVAGG